MWLKLDLQNFTRVNYSFLDETPATALCLTDELGVDSMIELVKCSATMGLAEPPASQEPRENTDMD